ncbi:MAG: hypothetical protein GX146_05080, partial [Myxococcales bacterium]|nr:hypothetical protein [Myxococcales bacterium]
MNVNCPGCNHLYKVDENRLPEGGQKMRCPKCNTSFRINRHGVMPAESQGAISLSPGDAAMSAVADRAENDFSDLNDDLALPSPAAHGKAEDDFSDLNDDLNDDLDDGIDLPGMPSARPASAPGEDDFGDLNDDLGGDLNLPAPKQPAATAKGGFGVMDHDFDLPAPKPPAVSSVPPQNDFGDLGLDFDLPAPSPQKRPSVPAGKFPSLPPEPAFGDIGMSATGLDAPQGEDPFGDIDLPSPAQFADLPAPSSKPAPEAVPSA